jgi:lysozyme
MKTGDEGIKLIKDFEKLRLKAYLDSKGVPTIGWGNTFYENGTKVKMGDTISRERADSLFTIILFKFEKELNSMLKVGLNQNQFDALMVFIYNIGSGAFLNSTILKKININPNDPSISIEFMRWNKSGGKALEGLTRRRQQEASLYFKKP